MDYPWAVNKLKLARALQGTTTEEEVKEKYVSLGGRILEEGEKVKITREGGTQIVSTEEDEEINEEKHVKKTPLAAAKEKRLKSIE